jgi:hypothetical protein
VASIAAGLSAGLVAAAFDDARLSEVGATVCLFGLVVLLGWWATLEAWAARAALVPHSPARPYAGFRALALTGTAALVTAAFAARASFAWRGGTGVAPPAETVLGWAQAAVGLGVLNAGAYLLALARTWRHLRRARVRLASAVVGLAAAGGIAYTAHALAGAGIRDLSELQLAALLLHCSWVIALHGSHGPFTDLAPRVGA